MISVCQLETAYSDKGSQGSSGSRGATRHDLRNYAAIPSSPFSSITGRSLSSTTLAQFLAAGEYPAALVYAHSIEDVKGKGAPIDWVRTTAPIVLDIQAVALSAQPPHPNAGKLFIDFLLSSEAQTIIYQDRKIPIRPGVVPESSALHPTGLELFPSPPKVVTNLNH